MAATGWLVGATEINVSINSLVTVVIAFAQHLTPCSSTMLLRAERQGNRAESRHQEDTFSSPWPSTLQHPMAWSRQVWILGKVEFLNSILQIFHHCFWVCRQVYEEA